MPKAELLEVRFWRHVKKTVSCWIWTSTKLPTGYGTIKADRSRENLYAHRVSWKLHFGPIPDGLFVLHKCDNTSCIRPDHLFLGNNADNMRDCSNKGRLNGCSTMSWHGEKSARSKLTWEAVKDIRSSKLSLSALAGKYGVQKGAIWKVKMGITWNENSNV